MTVLWVCLLICMFSLLLCQAEICGDAHQTANKGAFKVNMLNIPVCCDCGTVCSHPSPGHCLRQVSPPVCQNSAVWVQYWLAASGLHVVNLSSAAARKFEERSRQTLLKSLFVDLTSSPLVSLYAAHTSIQEGSSCCETLVRFPLNIFCRLSQKNSNKEKNRCSTLMCLGYLSEHQTFGLASFCVCAALKWKLHFYLISTFRLIHSLCLALPAL